MPNIFNVPGVPNLSSYAAGGLTLLSSDLSPSSLLTAAAQATLQWGIFLNGLPVVLPRTNLTSGLQQTSVLSGLFNTFVESPIIFPVVASFVDVEYKQDWPISDYPVEDGGFQSYDKVQLPFALRLRLAATGGPADLQSFLTAIQKMAEDTSNQFDVITPSQVYSSLSVAHYDYRLSATTGISMLVVDIWFIEIRITVSATLTSPLNAAFSGQQNVGISQAQPPSSNVQNVLSGQGMPY